MDFRTLRSVIVSANACVGTWGNVMSDTSKKSFLYLDQLSLRAKVTLGTTISQITITGMVNVTSDERAKSVLHTAQSAMFTAAFADS